MFLTGVPWRKGMECKVELPKVIVIGPGGGHLTEAMLATEGVQMMRIIATYCEPHTRASLNGEQFAVLSIRTEVLWKYALNAMQAL